MECSNKTTERTEVIGKDLKIGLRTNDWCNENYAYRDGDNGTSRALFLNLKCIRTIVILSLMEERCSNEITATGNQDYKRNISLGNNDYILSFGLVETGGFEKSPKVEALSCFLVCSNKNDPLLFQLNLQSEQLCHKAKVRLHLSMKLKQRFGQRTTIITRYNTCRLRRNALKAWASVQCLTIIKAAIRTVALLLNPTRQLITWANISVLDQMANGFRAITSKYIGC